MLIRVRNVLSSAGLRAAEAWGGCCRASHGLSSRWMRLSPSHHLRWWPQLSNLLPLSLPVCMAAAPTRSRPELIPPSFALQPRLVVCSFLRFLRGRGGSFLAASPSPTTQMIAATCYNRVLFIYSLGSRWFHQLYLTPISKQSEFCELWVGPNSGFYIH